MEGIKTGLFHDPQGEVPATEKKSRPPLRAGGLLMRDYCVIRRGRSLQQKRNPVRRCAPAVF
jgi:hypothetical protein